MKITGSKIKEIIFTQETYEKGKIEIYLHTGEVITITPDYIKDYDWNRLEVKINTVNEIWDKEN